MTTINFTATDHFTATATCKNAMHIGEIMNSGFKEKYGMLGDGHNKSGNIVLPGGWYGHDYVFKPGVIEIQTQSGVYMVVDEAIKHFRAFGIEITGLE